MRKAKNLLLLSIILIGLLGAYFYLRQKPAAKAPAAPAAPARPEIVLVKLDQVKINRLTIKSSQGNLTFVKQKGVWQTEPAQPYDLSQAQLETVASTFAALKAEELIDSRPHDLQQYGLTQPAVTVTVSATGQTDPFTLRLGDQTPAGSNYYAQRQGDPKVYAISGADGGRFMLTLNDLRNRDLPHIDPQQFQYFKLIRPGQPPVEIRENPERDQTGADYGINNWVLTQPYQEAGLTVNTDKFNQNILPALEGLEKQEYIADQPADLAQYGLDNPRYELIVKDKTGQTLHLLIGRERDSDYFYAKTPDAPAVFTLTNSILPVLTVKPFELLNRLSYIINIDTVAKIAVEANGVTETFTLSRKVKKARSKEEQDETVTTYRMDGKPVKEDVFKTFYRSLIGLAFEGDHPGRLAETNPEVKTTFYLNHGKVRIVRINYATYNNDFYAVFHNGHSEFLVSKDQVNLMLKDFKALAQGKLKARDL